MANITANSLNFDTTQMYGRGQIQVPAALLGTSFTGGGVDLRAVLILSCLPTSPYCRPNGAPSYLILGLGLNNLRQQMGHAMVQLVEALRYKPKDQGFDSRWCHYKCSLTMLPAAPWHWG
jgi:hypothetical protein